MSPFDFAPSMNIDGAVVRIGPFDRAVLLAGLLPDKLPGSTLFRGRIVIRHAMPFMYETDSFFMQRLVDDFGRDFRGQEAVDFAYRKGDAFPRAAVLGYRTSTGEHEQIYLKHLDLARPLTLVAYASEADTQPIAQLEMAVLIDVSVEDWVTLDDDERLTEIAGKSLPSFALPPDKLAQLADYIAQ